MKSFKSNKANVFNKLRGWSWLWLCSSLSFC